MRTTASLIKRLKEVLIRNVGDTRQCPKCRHQFVPNDLTAQESYNLYKTLFQEASKSIRIKENNI